MTFLTVTFAVREGVTHAQRVKGVPHATSHSAVIVRARKAAAKKGINVANVLTIKHRSALIFDYVMDTAARFR